MKSRPKSFSRRISALLGLTAMLVGGGRCLGQVISGTIAGTVVDSSNGAMPGASVTIIHEGTRAVREDKTDAAGRFVFTAVQPGPYTVRISAQGFRTVESTGNVLTANSTLELEAVSLLVGETKESITITAQANLVQTGSSENSGVLSKNQLDTIGTRGRDVTSLLTLLPGVSVGAVNEVPNGPGYGNTLPNIMGHPPNWSFASVDGLAGNDLGSANFFSSPNMDSIGEVQVQLNGYQAQYGGNSGAIINLITRSGTTGYHGSAYGFKRHEMFNAMNFFNNANGLRKPIYRFNMYGATLGGPIPIPRLRDRLFFFYSFENWQSKSPNSILQLTMPTALERQGDFSQTLDLNGNVIPVRDPQNKGAQFAGNIVPPSRINSSGQALLGLFPLPNILDRGITKGNYNFQFQESVDIPKTNHVFRVDYRPTDKDSIYVRGGLWDANNIGYNVPAHGPNFPLERAFYAFFEESLIVNHTHIFTSTMVNEFSIGIRDARESGGADTAADVAKIQRSQNGINIPQIYGKNPLGIIPRMSFGGVPSAPTVNFDNRFPIYGADTLMNLTETFSINRGQHALKAGFFLGRSRNGEGLNGIGNYMGTFDFSKDVNNPLDTNWAYGNALLGNFDSYTESSSRPRQRALLWNAAGFVQDTWKVNRKLTLDLGMRINWHNWWAQVDNYAAGFAMSRFNAGKAPALFRPVSTPDGRRGINPLTGEIVPAVYIGAYVPGTGDTTNGMVLNEDPNYPRGFRNVDRPQFEPRVGFAYDLQGNGKTAIRGSFGTFHESVENGGYTTNFALNPPVQFNPVIYYGAISSPGASSGLLFPSNVYGYDPNPKTPSLYNYNLNAQRDLGFQTILSAAYVGSLGRHLQWSQNINLVPYGARFQAQNADPTNPALPLNDNFFRPFSGYQNLTYNSNNGTSNYHALQTTLNRRFSKGLQFGVAYTWSKAMTFVDSDSSGVAVYRPVRVWNYGKAGFDQTHIFVFNYTWDLPKASHVIPGSVSRWVLDDWRLSGVTSFASGNPLGIGLSTVDGADITGGGDGVRVNVLGKAALDHGDRSLVRWFDPTVFGRPVKGDAGNAPKDVFRGPGINNWDATLFKMIPLGKETRTLQLRWEVYNAFNHTQFLGVDNGARFDATGKQVNARFGQVISARAPRVMQVSLRFAF